MGKAGGIFAFGVVFLAGFSATLLARGDDVAPRQKSSPGVLLTSIADGKARQAMTAELAGDDAGREALLAKALKEDPDCCLARWQSGYVRVDGKWMTRQEVARKYFGDQTLAEYVRRRDQAVKSGLFSSGPAFNYVKLRDQYLTDIPGLYDIPGTSAEEREADVVQSPSIVTFRSDAMSPANVAANIALANWCHSKRLLDEERAHWTQVLLNDPSNNEAQRRLGVRWFLGSILSNVQVEAVKKQLALEEKERAQWGSTVSRWKSAADAGTSSRQTQALAEMHDWKEPAVIPALITAAWHDSAKPGSARDAASPFQREAAALLGRLSGQGATDSLTQLSVFAKQEQFRAAAADELRKRNPHDFVPMLLNGLANPIEMESAISIDPSGMLIYSDVYSQEGPDKIRQSRVVDTGPTVVCSNKMLLLQPIPGPITRRISRYGQFADAIKTTNQRIREIDRRINLVLECATGKHSARSVPPPGDSDVIADSAVVANATTLADYWWTWWEEYNELYVPYKPTEYIQYQWSNCIPSTVSDPLSCFPAGTKVLTLVGPVAIEKIQIGDRVLAQDVETGELAYKPVLKTTVRPPSDVVAITTSAGPVRSTRGHLFWVDGSGWRMAKQLKVGQRLHDLHGASAVTAIGSASAETAYNLNVADFHTFFVGEAAESLVHDCSSRAPTGVTLPGLVASDRKAP